MDVAGFKAAGVAKATTFKNAFKSREGFMYAVKVGDTSLDRHGHQGKTTWSNEDLDPTPPHKRTWLWYNYVTFYLGLSFGNWTLGSTMGGIGLNWWQSILVVSPPEAQRTLLTTTDLCLAIHQFGSYVLQLSLCKRLSHWLPRCSTKCLRYVGTILLRRGESSSCHYMVWSSTVLGRIVHGEYPALYLWP